MGHKSHISSSEAKLKGWSRVPSPAIRRETVNLAKEVGSAYMNEAYLAFSGSLPTTSSGWDCKTDATYYPYQTWVTPWIDGQVSESDPSVITVREIIKEREVTKMVDKRTLFKVYIVDPKKNGKILLDGKLVIAVNENQAMLKVGVADVAEKAGLDLEQVDVYVQTIGTFIRPRKETQRVKITKEED